MKEATRQLILLIGVMTILTGGIVTITAAGTDSPESGDQRTPDKIQQPLNSTVNNSINGTVTDIEREEKNLDRRQKIKSNNSNIFVQSINGLRALWEDMKSGWAAILHLSNSSS
ncbi:MAG: hypothetical protein ABEK10_04530 [Candidatus Nanosalina sp.]